MSQKLCDWQQHFVRYGEGVDFYIYCDTNASYASIHQYLEDGFGKECVVANGNTRDAGACLAISYEARAKGVKRGASLRKALSIRKNLTVYESCLPLYELYADLYDLVLQWIVPSEMSYRGSCDEVIIRYRFRQYPYRKFWSAIKWTLAYVKEESDCEVQIRISKEQEQHIHSLSAKFQAIYAICYLIRDCIRQIIGLPISIAVAPSICLAKSFTNLAKPEFVKGERVYRTFHDAISFPHTREEANQLYRRYPLGELCGVQEIARRLEEHGARSVADIQDRYSLERTIAAARNLHLGKVVWHMCHGRDEVLSGYLSAIRDRK